MKKTYYPKFRVWDEESEAMFPVEKIDYDRQRQLLVYVLSPAKEIMDFLKKFDGEEFASGLYLRETRFSLEEKRIEAISDNKGGEYIPIMQYIGLSDKASKAIYEGDIVKHYFTADMFGTKSKKFVLGVIEKRTEIEKSSFGGFEIKYNRAVSPILQLYGGIDEVEVIGNIYQNPNLIKSK